MYGARNKLFACSSFTRDEDRRIAWRDFGDARENTFQSRRCSNDLFKHRGFVDFFTQGDVFLLQFLFNSFAVVNVSTRNIPTLDLPLFIVKRVETRQKPTKASIAFAHSQLQ